MKKSTATARNILTLAILGMFIVTATVLNGVAYASQLAQPHDAARPTVVPLPTHLPTPPGETHGIPPTTVVKVADPGAHIQLDGVALKLPSANMKAVVQWQALSGEWYDVEGWQTAVPTDSIQWWVAPKDFGKGPFRWAVYKNNNAGKPDQISKPFWLPKSAGDWEFVAIPT